MCSTVECAMCRWCQNGSESGNDPSPDDVTQPLSSDNGSVSQ